MTLPPNTRALTQPNDIGRGYVCTLTLTTGDLPGCLAPMWIGVGNSKASALRAALSHYRARPVAIPEGEGAP